MNINFYCIQKGVTDNAYIYWSISYCVYRWLPNHYHNPHT